MIKKTNDFFYIDVNDLREIMEKASFLGATQALVSVNKIPQYISKAEAYRRFGGRRKVEKWIVEGILKVRTAGIELLEILTLANSANLATYLNSNFYLGRKIENIK